MCVCVCVNVNVCVAQVFICEQYVFFILTEIVM